jgi:lipopolysaccharide exporter
VTQVERPPDSVSRQAAAGVSWIIAWRLVSRNLGLLSTLILVHLLQPTDFGLVTLAAGFINSVDALSAIGIQDALVREPNPDRAMYDTGFSLSILRGALTALLVAAIALPVGSFFKDFRLSVVMVALAAGTLISSFENIGIVDFRRDMAFRKEFDMQVWPRVAGIVTTITAASIWNSYWALVVGILVNRISRLAQSYLMSPYRSQLTLRAWRQLIGFSLWSWVQTILWQVRERSDSIVVGRYLDAAQVGVFSVGFELGFLAASELVEPLGRALFSGFALQHNADQPFGNMFLGAMGLGFLLLLPAGLGISMIADPLVRVTLGMKWLAAVPVVEILAVASAGSIFTTTCATMLNATGRPRTTAYFSTVSTATRIALLLILVPLFGLAGAADAVAVSVAIDVVTFLWVALPLVGVSLSQLIGRLIRPTIAAAAMVLLLWWLQMAWTPSQAQDTCGLITEVVTRSAIGAVCYAAVLGLAWVVVGQPEEAEHYALTTLYKLWVRWVLRK